MLLVQKEEHQPLLLGIAGCTMLVVIAFGMLDSLESYVSWEFGIINNFEYKLNLSTDYTDKQYDEIISKIWK